MSTFYQLLDLASGNVVDDFDMTVDTRAALSRRPKSFGKESIRGLSLMRISDEGQAVIAMEDDLVRLIDAFESSPETAGPASTAAD